MLLGALGGFQRRNFAVARAAAEAFLGNVDEDAVRAAAAETEVPGRLQAVGSEPLMVYDGAHNPAGAAALAEAIPEVFGERPLCGVFAILEDKDAAGMLQALLPHCHQAIFTTCSNARCLSPATLDSLATTVRVQAALRRLRGNGPVAETVPDPRAAVQRARTLAGGSGGVLVTGSIYLIADLVRDRTSLPASSL